MLGLPGFTAGVLGRVVGIAVPDQLVGGDGGGQLAEIIGKALQRTAGTAAGAAEHIRDQRCGLLGVFLLHSHAEVAVLIQRPDVRVIQDEEALRVGADGSVGAGAGAEA